MNSLQNSCVRVVAAKLMLNRLGFAAIASVLLCSWVNQATAQSTSYSVSPRIYTTWIEADEFSEPIFVPMVGLSVSVAPAPLPRWDFTLNGLYGEGDSDFRSASLDTSFGFGGDGHVDVTRGDIEFLMRYRFPDSGAYVVGAARYIHFKEEFFLDATSPFFFAGKVDESIIDIYLGEFGGGVATGISKNGRHALFGNVVIGLGKFESEEKPSNCNFACIDTKDDGFAYLVDTNFGYQYAMKSWLSLSLRYRLIAVQTSGEERDLALVHGPEVAATFRF